MFPILFGKEALEKQLENADGSLKRGYYKDILMDQKINQEAIRDFEGYYNHFKRQLEKNKLINTYGICYGYDYIVVAKRI